MQRTTRKIYAVGLAATLLAACQPAPLRPVAQGPVTVPAVSLLPAGPSRLDYKPGDDNAPGSAQVISQAGKDKITIRLARRPEAKPAGFKSQAVNVNDLAFVRVWVTGPGISGMIESDQGEVAYPPTTITLSDVPSGDNRVITAQYYDSAHQPIPSAVAKGVYSTSGTGPIPVEIRRRFVPLGRIIEDLMVSNPLMAKNLDTEALQIQLDNVLFSGTGGVPDTSFDTDPALLDLEELTNDIRDESGDSSDLDINDYIQTTASLHFEIAGLVGTDTVTVRVGDTTSSPQTLVGNGPVTVNNIAPGVWPVYVFSTTGSNQGYAYENSTLSITGSTRKPPLLFAGGTKAWHQPPEFVIGETIDLGTYTLAPKALRLGPLPPTDSPLRRIREGSIIAVTGEFFHHSVDQNQVIYENLDSDNSGDDRVVTAGAKFALNPVTSLNLMVPPLKAGRHRVSIAVAGGPPTSLGIFFANTWYVKPDGNPSASGSNWEEATTLQNALAQSVDGQTILLEVGTYRPSESDQNVSFAVNKHITLDGGYVNNGHGEYNKLGAPADTVLSGDLGQNDDPGDLATLTDRADNSRHVIMQHGDLYLDNLTVSGGHAEADNGGAIHNMRDGTNAVDGYLTQLKNVVIENNSATFSGGGIYLAQHSRALYEDAVFRNNVAATARGGGSASFNDFSLERRVIMNRVRFENNYSASGGGLYIEGGVNASLSNLVFVGNRGFFPSTENFAEPRGGAFLTNHATGTLDNAVFAGNEASAGGALYLSAESNYTLNHVSFANNRHAPSASTQVCGTSWFIDASSSLILRNSIAWSSAATVVEANRGDFTGCSDGTLEIRNSLIDGLASIALTIGSANVDGDPKFVAPNQPLGDDGEQGTGDDGLILGSGSDARNIGGSTTVQRDLRNFPRDASPNAGAYESN